MDMSWELEFIDAVLDYIRLGKIEKAKSSLEQLVIVNRYYPSSVLGAITYLVKGLIVVSMGDNERGLRYARHVLDELSSLSLSEVKMGLLIKVKNLEALCLFNMGRRDEALVKYEENLAILQKNHEQKEDLGICLNNIGYYYLMKGRYLEAQRYFEQALNVLQEIELVKKRWEVLAWRFRENIALSLIRQGKFTQASSLLSDLLDEARIKDDLLGQMEALHDLGIIKREQGKLEESLEYLTQSLIISRQIHNRRREAMILGDLGELHLKEGRVDEAHQYLLQSIELARDIHNEEEVVKRLCQLSEVEEILGRNIRSLERLNQASRMARSHSSEEELEYVKMTIAMSFFRKGLLEIASILFSDVYNDSLSMGNGEFITNCRLYLSAIQISRYLDDKNVNYLDKARDHLESLIGYSSRQNLVTYFLIGKILLSILQMFTLNTMSAEKELAEARDVAIDVGNEKALRTILNLESILTYIAESKERGASGAFGDENDLLETYLTQGSLTFLREFAIWTTILVSPPSSAASVGDAFVTQEKLGPELFYASSVTLQICDENDLIRSTYALTAVFGQGSSYFEGLFGPIPISKSIVAMVYTKILPDSQSPDERFNGRNYGIYLLLLPFEYRIPTQIRECLKKLLDNWFGAVSDVRLLTSEWFQELREEILKNCFFVK